MSKKITLLQVRGKDNYVSKCGWVYKGGTTNEINELIDPNGKLIYTGDHWDVKKYLEINDFIVTTYYSRYGRNGDTTMDIKFGPGHFPIGTEFLLDEKVHVRNIGPYTVKGIYKNGPNSFVLETTTLNDEINKSSEQYAKEYGIPYEPIYHSFNIDNVKSIIKRGGGVVKINHTHDSQHYLSQVNNFSKVTADKKVGYIDIHQLAMYYFSQLDIFHHPDVVIDLNKLFSSIHAQTWIKPVTIVPNPEIVIYQVDLKRLKKFIKRNASRFLMNHRKALELNDAMYEDDSRDWELD